MPLRAAYREFFPSSGGILNFRLFAFNRITVNYVFIVLGTWTCEWPHVFASMRCVVQGTAVSNILIHDKNKKDFETIWATKNDMQQELGQDF